MKLKNIVQIKSGKRIPKGTFLINIKNSHPYIKVKDMKKYKIKLNDNFEYVPDNIFPKISKYTVNTGDVILSIVGTIGNVSIIDQSLDNASLTENCVKLVPNDELLSEYLYYFLISSNGKTEIQKGIIGSTQPKLPFYNIEQINIPLIDINKQKHIVNTIYYFSVTSRISFICISYIIISCFSSSFIDTTTTNLIISSSSSYSHISFVNPSILNDAP